LQLVCWHSGNSINILFVIPNRQSKKPCHCGDYHSAEYIK